MRKVQKLCTICRSVKCRRGRPCAKRKDNPRNATCYCTNYHFPHRTGSGRCESNSAGIARMNELVYGVA